MPDGRDSETPSMKLSTYSWLAVLVAVAVAAIGWLGLAGWMAVLVVLASIGMHVAGNAIGTRLRDDTDRGLEARGPMPFFRSDVPEHAPTRLERSESLGRLVPVSAAIGGVAGGAIGGGALAFVVESSIAGAVLGGISSAVIGGLLGFLLAGFVEIIRTSIADAIAAERSAATRRDAARIASPTGADLVRYELQDFPPSGDQRS